MRVDRGILGWGVFFLVLGAVPLAVQAGFLSPEALDRWWTYWPLVVIGIGLGLLLARTRFEVLGGLVVAVAFGLMVGGAAASGIGGIAGIPSGVCGPADGGTPFASSSGPLGPRAEVDLELDCGDLTVTTTTDGQWTLEGTSEDGTAPRLDASQDALEIRSGGDGPDFLADRAQVSVGLPTASTMDLEVQTSAGSLDVDLAGASLETLDVELNAGDATLDLAGLEAIAGLQVEVNAGSIRIFLPNHSLTGEISVNAGSVQLCAPDDVALRLETGSSVLASHDFGGTGLVQQGSAWMTPGFESAATRIDLQTEANAGSFTLGGEVCAGG
jgi:hypothetical protein